jgi:hypothetical protein
MKEEKKSVYTKPVFSRPHGKVVRHALGFQVLDNDGKHICYCCDERIARQMCLDIPHLYNR